MPLVYYGDPILRHRAREVEGITDRIHSLVTDLKQVMVTHQGCGIAAPMVGVALRVIVVQLDQLAFDDSVLEGEVMVFINPKLSNRSKETWVMDEGNLSIPGIRVPVERPREITLDALGLDGQQIHLKLEGLAARIAMHEHDVLNGVLMIDRTSSTERRRIEAGLRLIRRK